MAKMKLSESKFNLIAEGTYTFKVMEVIDDKYEDYGKLSVKLQTSKGEIHFENFTLLKKNGEINDGALKAWSYFARVCLNNFQADEIDTQDIVGCYITATVKHEKFTLTQGDNTGKEGTAVRLNDYATASGFGNSKAETPADIDTDEDENLDEFLND